MRFDEPDVREAYRRGVRDCFEIACEGMKSQQTRKFETWLDELEAWDDGDPPAPPLL